MQYRDELQTATEIAKEAGKQARKWQNQLENVRYKEDSLSYVTEADTQTQQLIVSRLQKAFPEDGFLGEEDNLEPNGEDRVWVIDPIDGTNNYIRGYPHYCVSIALREGNEYVVGVIYDPLNNELFTGSKGNVAQLNGEHISVADTGKLSDALLSAYKSDADIFQELKDRIRNIRVTGTAALDAAYVAAGRSDIYIDNHIHEWDIAAAACIVQEAGGRTIIRKGDNDRGHVHFLATNSQLFDTMKDFIQE